MRSVPRQIFHAFQILFAQYHNLWNNIPVADEFSIQGQTALVTGAARRLGRATALALAEAGAHVCLHYNSSDRDAEELALRIRALGVKAWPIQADLSEAQGVEKLFSEALGAAEHLDILINNASVFPRQAFREITAEALDFNIRVNASAPLLLSKMFAEHVEGERTDSLGVIINFLDTHITAYHKAYAAYHVSKRMLFTVTRMLALEYAPRVRVNAVAPGLILAPRGEDDNYLQNHARDNPLQTHGNEADITAAVLFLIRSRFVTGQVLFVDGGYHMKGNTYGC
jgi:pteridine reductase